MSLSFLKRSGIKKAVIAYKKQAMTVMLDFFRYSLSEKACTNNLRFVSMFHYCDQFDLAESGNTYCDL